MYKYMFFNDYSEGAHPAVLELLAKNNLVQEEGYGRDSCCLQAETILKGLMESPGAAVHFIPGGTQTNLIMLAAMLKPYESVIAAGSAHIHHHEAGAVEATGHKINVVQSADGKLTPLQIRAVIDAHTDEHMVKPGAVFISQSTELGTVYSKSELEALSQTCRARKLYLYLDGARLGAALVSREADLGLACLAGLVDAFYIGGTKNGALIGEAAVIVNRALQPDFRYHLKQRGALLAKGRLLGIQFAALFRDNLYFDLARHANAMAGKIAAAIKARGFSFLTPPVTNQLFPVLPNALIGALQKDYGFYTWQTVTEKSSAARLVTSWAVQEETVDEFINAFNRLAGQMR